MNSHANWMQHFKDRIKSMPPDGTQVGRSLLWQALKSKKIKSHEYLEWVQTELGAIILRSDFFLSHPINDTLFKKFKSIYNWSPECLPLYEWDQVLYVGCLEAPKNFNYSKKVIFVYTTVEGLEAGWNQWRNLEKTTPSKNKTVTESLSDDDPLAALEKTMILTKKAKPSFEDEWNGLANDPSDEFSSSEELSSEPAERMEGLNFGAANDFETNLDSEENSPDGFSSSPPPQFSKSEPNWDDHPKLDSTRIVEATAINIPLPIKKKKQVSEETSIGSKINEGTVTSFLDKTRIVDATAVNIPLPPKKKQSQGINDGATAISSLTTTRAVPPADPKKQKEMIEIASAPTKKGKKARVGLVTSGTFQPSVFDIVGNLDKAKVEKACTHILSEMKPYFSKSMIIKINGHTFTPWKWDAAFTGGPEKAPAMTLQTPSIFRIPWRTRKPYHGYIVPNDINETFFDIWNHAKIPDHATIVPIIVHDNVTGLLMGIANKPINTEDSLAAAERLAEILVEQLMGGRSRAS
jgi:hypothetical protein